WLLINGYLNTDKKPVVRNQTVYTTTPSSKDVGIITQDNIDLDTGEVDQTIVLTKTAQEFIIDNLENIVGLVENIKLPDPNVKYPELEMIGQKWTEEEQQRLIREFTEEKLTIARIAELHHRKSGGIRSRLIKLGLIEK
ncbi:MAG: hypothetical protein HDP28_03800, partial [Clostridia bacterium]|nr:hypothetical protein [Clostridia bacterium]